MMRRCLLPQGIHKKGRGSSFYLSGVKNAVLVPHRVFNLFSAQYPQGYWAEKKMTGDNVLFQNWFLLGMKNVSSHAYKTGSWYLLGVLFKIFLEHPSRFYMGVVLDLYCSTACSPLLFLTWSGVGLILNILKDSCISFETWDRIYVFAVVHVFITFSAP